MRRRSYLASVTVCLGGLAGCSSDDGLDVGIDDFPEGTDSPAGDGTDSPQGTPTPTPMPAETFGARLIARAEQSGLEGEFGVETGDDGNPYLRYSAVKGARGDQRDRARKAYDSLVEEGPVGRDLDARVVNRDTGEQWFRWRAAEAWARAYVSGDMSEGEYQQKIDKTVEDW